MFTRTIKHKVLKLKRRHRQKANPKPPYTHCKNCGEELHGMYCSKCGQYASEANRPFMESVKLYLEHHYGLDHKLGSTLKYLFFKPGFLAREYMEGRIERHVHPFKLYFFASILLFGVALSSSHGSSNKKEMGDENKPLLDTTSTGALKVNTNKSTSISDSAYANKLDSAVAEKRKETATQKTDKKNHTNVLKENTDGGLIINIDNDSTKVEGSDRLKKNLAGVSKKELMERAFHYLSMSALFLMPVFALLLLLVYHRRECYYTGHLILSVHLHVVLFLAISLSLLWSRFISEAYSIGGWMFLAMMVYFILSLSNFCREKIIKSLLKTIPVLFAYFIVCIFAAVGVVLLVFFY